MAPRSTAIDRSRDLRHIQRGVSGEDYCGTRFHRYERSDLSQWRKRLGSRPGHYADVRKRRAELRQPVFCATCGVSFVEHTSLMKSSASQALPSPSVIAVGRSARCSVMCSRGHPSAAVSQLRQGSTTRPWRVSISLCPKRLCDTAWRPDLPSKHGCRLSVYGHGSSLRHCARRVTSAARQSRPSALLIGAQASISVPPTEKSEKALSLWAAPANTE